jgi:predicted nucleic acid-binding protein
MILFDTSVLSIVFRRRQKRPEQRLAQIYRDLIQEGHEVAIPGIVVQELLSGVRTESQFSALLQVISGFDIRLALLADHLAAANVMNQCRRSGVACSAIDALIAALAIESNAKLFTTDRDFQRIASCSSLRLYEH